MLFNLIGHIEFEMAAIHARGENADNSIMVGKGLKMQIVKKLSIAKYLAGLHNAIHYMVS